MKMRFKKGGLDAARASAAFCSMCTQVILELEAGQFEKLLHICVVVSNQLGMTAPV